MAEKNKTSEAQIRANRKWEQKNHEYTKKMRYLRNARTFFRHHADDETVKELLEIYKNENENAKGNKK